MNDHFASIVHEERMAQLQREADASRRAAQSGAGMRFGSRWIPVGVAAVMAALLALAVASSANAHGPTCSDSTGLDVVVHGQRVVCD
jgi:hypothetical protein